MGNDDFSELRKRAEEKLADDGSALDDAAPEDVRTLVHELRTHQIELELQNEELRQAQTALARSRDLFVELYDFAPVGYLTLDRGGVIAQANHTAARMLGIGRGKLLRRTFADFVDRDAQDEWFRYRRAVSAGSGNRAAELALRRADQTPFTARLEVTVSPVTSDEGGRVMLAMIDVTEKRRAEETARDAHADLGRLVEERTADLRESEQRYRSLAENIQDIVYATDADGILQYVAPRAERYG